MKSPKQPLPGRGTTRAGTSSAVCGARKTNRLEDQGLASSAADATGPGPIGTGLLGSAAAAGAAAGGGTAAAFPSAGFVTSAEVEWLCQNKPKPRSSTAVTAMAITTRGSAKIFCEGATARCWYP